MSIFNTQVLFPIFKEPNEEIEETSEPIRLTLFKKIEAQLTKEKDENKEENEKNTS